MPPRVLASGPKPSGGKKLTEDKRELFLKNVASRKRASNGKFTWTAISVEFDVSF